ncbi:uncharacterized protein LOC102079180 [Oreochromis niloticus]|uniref:uncharacterized protein LOC102079180 n=1 Tax=Oreochromis niloticus TaxID=8128 RepID=UPI000905D84D|nr:uncharacterized protein LOC102079180 [Oreochromis niloticus]
MSAVTLSLCSTFLFFGVLMFVSAEQKTITADSGQDVTLTCRAPDNKIIALVWIRADLKTANVLFYENGRFVPDDQHPFYKNRVDMLDRQMKDGELSVTLKDVTTNDTGTYECHVVQGVGKHLTLISNIYLYVVPPGQTGGDIEDGSLGLILRLSVPAVVLVLIILKLHKHCATFWKL